MAIEPQSSKDREALSAGLAALAEDDPTLRVSTHPETGQTIVAGMGELHLDVLRGRLHETFGVECTTGAPQIAYRETITGNASADHLLKKQHGGAGQYARVVVTVQPGARGSGRVIEDKITGGVIPRQFIPGCLKGAEDALRNGVLGGHPVVDVRIELVDGHFHQKDSNELTFRLASRAAVREALAKAGPILLEPVMRVECNTPGEYQGDLLGDLTRRRGRITGVESLNGHMVLQAEVPLAEMFGYTNSIRSLSKGRASHAMSPSHFEPVPEALVNLTVGSK
jgi:elongation factor G